MLPWVRVRCWTRGSQGGPCPSGGGLLATWEVHQVQVHRPWCTGMASGCVQHTPCLPHSMYVEERGLGGCCWWRDGVELGYHVWMGAAGGETVLSWDAMCVWAFALHTTGAPYVCRLTLAELGSDFHEKG